MAALGYFLFLLVGIVVGVVATCRAIKVNFAMPLNNKNTCLFMLLLLVATSVPYCSFGNHPAHHIATCKSYTSCHVIQIQVIISPLITQIFLEIIVLKLIVTSNAVLNLFSFPKNGSRTIKFQSLIDQYFPSLYLKQRTYTCQS